MNFSLAKLAETLSWGEISKHSFNNLNLQTIGGFIMVFEKMPMSVIALSDETVMFTESLA